VRAAARRRGLAEREVYVAERGFDWSELTHAGASRSLFGGGKILELRVPGGKPGVRTARRAIEAHCARLDPEGVTLVSLPRLDRAGQSSSWFGALAAAGVVVEVWPVERARLPQWIGARLARQGQKRRARGARVPRRACGRQPPRRPPGSAEARAAGAARRELALETVQAAVAPVARYDPYAAAEALAAGNLARYARVLQGLRGEGEAPTFVLFALAGALAVLRGAAEGKPAERLFGEHRVFNKPLQRALAGALGRHRRAALEAALAQAARIDRVIKGVAKGDAWDEFLALGLLLSGGSKA
jgi:DNA polymerase III subunit delta